MKEGIERSVRCPIALALTVVMIYKMGIILRPLNTDSAFNAINTFHNMPENTLEVISYGSSLPWTAIDAMEMYEKYGIGAYNYGCTWQHFNTTNIF